MPGVDRSPTMEPRRPNRREFLWALGAAGTLPLAGAAAGWAQPPATPAPAPSAPSTPEPASEPDPDKAADAADAQSLLEIVERRFGSRFTAEQLESVRGDLEDGLRAARTLRRLPLGNADEPDIVFRALPEAR